MRREGDDFLPQVFASLLGSGVKSRLGRGLRVSGRRLVGVQAEDLLDPGDRVALVLGLTFFLDLDDQRRDLVALCRVLNYAEFLGLGSPNPDRLL